MVATKGKKRKAAPGGASGSKSKQSKTQTKGRGSSNKKNGTKKPQQSTRHADRDEDEDVEIDEEDVAFYEDNEEFTSFLANMDTKALKKSLYPKSDKKASPKPVKEQDEKDEMPLEKLEARPRKAAWATDKQEVLKDKLPVKFMDGSVRSNKLLAEKEEKPKVVEEEEESEEEEKEQEENDEEMDSDVSDMEFEEITDADASAPTETPKPELSPVDLKRQRELRLVTKKVEIAQLCESILEDPEESFKKNKEHPQQLSKIQQLQELCRDPDAIVQRLSLPLEKLEARPRKAAWATDKQEVLKDKLPVKFMDGSVRSNKLLAEKEEKPKVVEEEEESEEEEKEQEENDEEMDSDVSDMEFEEITDADAPKPELSPVDLKRQRELRLVTKKVEIAQLCESILEDPEESFKKNKEHPQQLSKIQQLQELCRDPDAIVQRLSLMSQLSVFLDILPDYRIRLQKNDLSAEEKGKQNHGRPMKKKVQQMQDYEAALLNNYQKFLKYCAELVTTGLKGKRPEQMVTMTARERRDVLLAETGVRCLAQLLEKKYAFNFHLNLVIALVPMADSQFPSVREQACASFESVFKSDKTCVCSYEIVQQISSYVKQKQHRVQPFIIRTLLVMPLEVTMEQGEAARKKAKSDRKKRRRQQAEGDTIAAVSRRLRLLWTALPAVLEGLAKFSFLINLDIMIDLLKVLKVVLREEDVLPLPAALQAVLTGMRALQGPGGQELMVDDKEFVDILYRLLHRFAEGEAGSDSSCFTTLLQCVEAVFLRRKEIVVERVASFVKRLLLVAQHLPPHQALAILSLLRALFHRYSKLQQLLESDVDRVASGEYRADIDDPDFANPFSSACWELALLTHHVHPKLSSYALGTAQLAPTLPNEHAQALMDAYDPYAGATFTFKPKVPVPPSNPLHKKIASENNKNDRKKSRQRRARQFFVRDPLASLDEQYRKQNASSFFQKCLELDEQRTDDKLLVFKK
ncbi:TOM1 protein 2 [Phytophthora nicotianae]|uniref:TOM1 protein 2 n=1 Tax=Phytophthora nicotianae TaxID=4792 RepID=A0A0W8DLJ5_PHYNI|nr:TOM1 protein 2 [Phytophthora nicotianae]